MPRHVKYSSTRKIGSSSRRNKIEKEKNNATRRLFENETMEDINSNICKLYFNNLKGTCWMISILMIVLMNNKPAMFRLLKIKKIDKDKTYIKKINHIPELLKALPNFMLNDKGVISNKHIDLVHEFFIELKNRLTKKIKIIKTKKHKNTKVIGEIEYRTNNDDNNDNDDNKTIGDERQTCEIKLHKAYMKIFCFKNRTYIGGTNSDSFALLLLLSIFLCNELYSYILYPNPNFLNINFNNLIGIDINIFEHVLGFYKCNNELYFCNNNYTVLYDWETKIKEFNTSNTSSIYYTNNPNNLFSNKFAFGCPKVENIWTINKCLNTTDYKELNILYYLSINIMSNTYNLLELHTMLKLCEKQDINLTERIIFFLQPNDINNFVKHIYKQLIQNKENIDINTIRELLQFRELLQLLLHNNPDLIKPYQVEKHRLNNTNNYLSKKFKSLNIRINRKRSGSNNYNSGNNTDNNNNNSRTVIPRTKKLKTLPLNTERFNSQSTSV